MDGLPLRRNVGYAQCTPIEQGVEKFVAWYCGYYGQR